MTQPALRCGIYFHPGVSDGGTIQEYADPSARDVAGNWRFSRLAKIVIVSSAAIRAPKLARTPAATARELATMATTYHDNVSTPVQPVEAVIEIRSIGLSDLHRALKLG